jgi:hypothetical protein
VQGRIIDTSCPECGGQASEYDVNHWQCLSCGARFIYEPPQQPLSEADVTIAHVQAEMYTCSCCGGFMSAATIPLYTCGNCGAQVCQNCGQNCWHRFEGYPFLCPSCIQEFQRHWNARQARRAWLRAAGVILALLAMWVLFVGLQQHFREQDAKRRAERFSPQWGVSPD